MAYLEGHGVEAWLDELRIRVGDSIVAKMNEGISGASHVALLVSKESATRPWVAREFSAALMRQLQEASVRVLPIRLDDSPVPAILADIRYADWRSDEALGFRQVYDAVVGAES